MDTLDQLEPSVPGTWILALTSVVAVSLLSLVGLATLSLHGSKLRRVATILVSFAVGTLLGDVFLHLLPEALSSGAPVRTTLRLVLVGFCSFFALEKLLRHQHGPLHLHQHPAPQVVPELAAINLVGDALHNFVDGALIGASYLASPALGVSTTIAVAFHELPQELGDLGVLVHSGLGARKALALNLASATVAIAGALLVLVAGDVLGPIVASTLVPVTAGGFIYIAAADLVPELQHDRTAGTSAVQASFVALGVLIMLALAANG